VQRPTDPAVLATIHRTIEHVLMHGPAFEVELMRRENANPKFAFLFKHDVSASPLRAIHRGVPSLCTFAPEPSGFLTSSTRSSHQCAEHVYYRWKVYSLLCGDSITKWREESFVMYETGPTWLPPRISAEEAVS
jgi:U2-associated protein SR140